MRCHDAKRGFTAPRGACSAQPMEQSRRGEDVCTSVCSSDHDASLPETPSLRLCAGISTERIMHAVERQRRITQQLNALRTQQEQRTAFLRSMGLKFVMWLGCTLVTLASVFTILSMLQPVLLVRTLTLFSGFIALLLAAGMDIQEGLSLIPSNNWILSGAALVVVLMMVMWLRLMRHPHEA